jgi:hypothetical protein
MSEALYPGLRAEHVAWLREQIEDAIETLAKANAGWRFHESHDEHPPRDVTAERVADSEEVIAKSEAMIAAFERADRRGL